MVVNLGHLLVAYFLSDGIDGVINFRFHSQTLRRLGRFNQVDNHFVADQGLSTPVHADNENNPCSILFHLLVAGGRW